jgi:hypothetical protein
VKHDEKLFLKLLPEVYAERDGEDGPQKDALRGLMQVLSEPAEKLNQNVQQLYDDMFIETCADWVVPYIGDLLGVRGLHTLSGDIASMRAWIANTLNYRRRKGTHYAIGLLAEDVSGYGAVAGEMFERLGWNQHLDHLRDQSEFVDFRNINQLELVDTILDTTTKTVEVRRVNNGRGKYNIQNVALGLWRLHAYPLTNVRCQPRAGNPGEYFMDPLGRDVPLFNSPERDNPGLANEIRLPKALRRLPLFEDIEEIRAAGTSAGSAYFDSQPVFAIRVRGAADIPADKILICNLETWQDIPAGYDVGIDPLNGRVKFLVNTGHPKEVFVDYSYGGVSDIGGGPYDRNESVAEIMPDKPQWYRVVSTDPALTGQLHLRTTLKDAIDDWNGLTNQDDGLIVVLDSDTYSHTAVQAINLKSNGHLMIVSALWPAPTGPRDYALINATDVRPTIIGDFDITGTAGPTSQNPGRLTLSGLQIHGQLKVSNGNLGGLEIEDCTLTKAGSGLRIEGASGAKNRNLELLLKRVFLPNIEVIPTVAAIELTDGIIEGKVDAIQSPANIVTSTIGDTVHVRRLDASDCIFNQRVTVERTQEGCVRFCYLPPLSKVPRPYRCQPEYAIQQNPTVSPDRIRSRVTPNYVSVTLGNPAYRQLTTATATEILTGASNGCEMGVYNRELQQYRLSNLSTTLNDYMRLGMEFGFFFEN